jgi:glucokinase
LVLDIGGTWTRAAAVCGNGVILHAIKQRTPSATTPTEIVLTFAGLVADVRERCRADDGVASRLRSVVGVSVTGPVDPRNGRLFSPPNTGPGLAGLALQELLSEQLGATVVVDRDTNAALLAEVAWGAARDCTDVVYVTVSTGVGGAALLNGQLLRGVDGVAGEVGHVSVTPSGPMCGCGRRGCLEAIASGPAIARAAAARAAQGSPLDELCRSQGAALAGEHVQLAATRGDPVAVEILEQAGAAVVSAAVDLVNVFNPQLVVIGGSVAAAHPAWIEAADVAVRSRALEPAGGSARVLAAALGDNGGLLGAALLRGWMTDSNQVAEVL